MRRKIPSTAALVAFESAARHQSFTKAADELNLTQSAICRQIGGLESFLNVELFRRSRRGVILTEAGVAYSRKVAAQLDAVERDTLALMGNQGTTSIELAVVPTFGTQWLLPRLRAFQRLHPEVTVHLTNRTRPFLFADTHFDAAIYYGDAEWSGTEQQTTRPYAWRQWFAAQGMSVARDMTGPRLELFSMLAQAAQHEMGIALIPPFLIQRELEEGSLVIAFDRAVPNNDRAYYLMVPERKAESAALKAFRDWLLAQADAYRDS